MGYDELSQTVRGSGGTLSTNTNGVVQTDNYDEGGYFEVVPSNGDSYPVSIDPPERIQVWKILETGEQIHVTLTTKTGTVIGPIELRAVGLSEDTLELDELTLSDPAGTGAATYGYWSGE